MKLSRILFLLGLAANAVTLLSYFWVIQQPGSSGAGMIYVLFIFPTIWIIFLVIAVSLVVTLRNRTGTDNAALRVVAFLLCTPIPILCVAFGQYLTEEKEPERFSTSVEYKDHVAYKSEVWMKDPYSDIVQRYFKADSIKLQTEGETAYRRDSVWVYYGRMNDTLKVEFYKDDQLIRTLDKRKK